MSRSYITLVILLYILPNKSDPQLFIFIGLNNGMHEDKSKLDG